MGTGLWLWLVGLGVGGNLSPSRQVIRLALSHTPGMRGGLQDRVLLRGQWKRRLDLSWMCVEAI